jgi:hypothetical protein
MRYSIHSNLLIFSVKGEFRTPLPPSPRFRRLEVTLLAVKMRFLGCDSSKYDSSVTAVLCQWV